MGGIDVAKKTRLPDIQLGGHPESFQLELNGPRIYVNVPAARQIAVIDRKKSKVVATWRLEKAEANFPMALDGARDRLYVGCRKPAVVLVYDTETGKVLNRFP